MFREIERLEPHVAALEYDGLEVHRRMEHASVDRVKAHDERSPTAVVVPTRTSWSARKCTGATLMPHLATLFHPWVPWAARRSRTCRYMMSPPPRPAIVSPRPPGALRSMTETPVRSSVRRALVPLLALALSGCSHGPSTFVELQPPKAPGLESGAPSIEIDP